MPVMTAHAIYGRCKNQELITLFNKQAFCIVYKRMKQEWLELAQYVVNQSSEDKILLSSSFSLSSFTLVALNNFDNDDKNSP